MRFPSVEFILAWLISRDAPVSVQFVKYGLCGVVSTLILLAIVLPLSHWVIPAADGMIIDGVEITDATRQRNLIINNFIAFPVANGAAYLLNTWLVFTPGRHSRLYEFTIFTVIAAISFGAGLLGGPMLIERFGITSGVAQLSLVITSASVNFLCRKFLVFLR